MLITQCFLWCQTVAQILLNSTLTAGVIPETKVHTCRTTFWLKVWYQLGLCVTPANIIPACCVMIQTGRHGQQRSLKHCPVQLCFRPRPGACLRPFAWTSLWTGGPPFIGTLSTCGPQSGCCTQRSAFSRGDWKHQKPDFWLFMVLLVDVN